MKYLVDNLRLLFIVAITTLILSEPAFADLTWVPLIFPVQVYTKLWLLPFALFIDWAAIKYGFRLSWKKTLIALLGFAVVGILGGAVFAGFTGFTLEIILTYIRININESIALFTLAPLIIVPSLSFLKIAVLKVLYGTEIQLTTRNIAFICMAQISIFALYITAHQYLPTP